METGFIAVENGQLYYEKTGQGDPLVLIHDGLVHGVIWDYFFEHWADRHTLVRYDRRGYGKSPAPTQEFSQIDDLRAVMDSLGIAQAALMGGSAGGGLAIDFTLAHPERVTHLTLIGAVVSGMPYSDHFITRGGRLTPEIYGDRERFTMYWVTGDPYEIYEGNPAALARAHDIIVANMHNMNTANNRLATAPARPALPNLSEIKVPTLIVVGEQDHPDVHAHAGAIEAGIAGARRVIFTECGHLVPLEKPEVLADAITIFFSEADFFEVLEQDGPAAAAELFKNRHKEDPQANLIGEARLNGLGYEYFMKNDLAGAVEIFRLNVELHPGSSNVYDSYGEALLASGDTTGAITNYEKSLELNPANTNAESVLDRIRK